MIFLIGTQKSGTTWLRDCFAHVCPVPKRQEWYFVEFYERIALHIDAYGHLAEYERNSVCRRVVAAAWQTMLGTVTPGAVFDKSAYPCSSTVAPIRNDLHPLAVQLARDVFPEARTVVIVRDPRAVLNSALHYLNYFYPGRGAEIDPVEFGVTWQLQNSRWLADRPSVVVRFEDLKTDFVGSLKHIFAAVDLPHSPECLSEILREELDIEAVRSRQPEIYRVGAIDDYKAHLSPVIVRKVEEAAAALMAQLGYSPTT